MKAIDAVLAQERETARVHVLDRRDVDAARILRAPRRVRRVAQAADERQGGAARLENGTSARQNAGRSETTRSVTSVITPSVPSEPMKRSMRSISGCAK